METPPHLISYREYLPCPSLSPYIDKYWEFEGKPEYGMRIHILPDGCVDFIFTLGEVANTVGGSLVMHPYRSYFVGPMNTYSELVTYAETVHMLGVRFLPGGIFHFADLPLQELVNKRVSTADLPTLFDDSFAERMCELTSTSERIHLLENILLRFLAHHNSLDSRQDLAFAVHRIKQSKGNLSIDSLTRQICLCPRQFERRFKMFTGYTAKEYSRIIRFQNTIDLLRELPGESLLSIAVKAGYYDVSHLSREIKRLSGNTPSSFASLPLEETALTYVKP